jgi:hypothetical protein
MDLPIEVINAVKEPLVQPKPKARKPYVKKLTKRILHAIGNGLRTATSVSNALGVEKAKIQSNLWHMKTKGLIYASKQEGKAELKYHLTTDKPVLDTLNLDKPKRKVVKVAKVVTPEIRRATKEEVELMQDKERLAQRISSLELTLVEKEKEVWSLECDVFDKKAIIKYLEEKLFVLGVR